MIIQLFVFALIVFLGALLRYPFYKLVDTVYQASAEADPSFVSGIEVDFLMAISYWAILLVFLIPGLIWFFINVQRPKRYE